MMPKLLCRHVPLVLLLGLLSACSSFMPGSSAREKSPVYLPPPDLSDYRLGIGDGVKIEVFGEENLSMSAGVDPSGHIGYPLLGSIKAVDKTAMELQQELRARLSSGYLINPDVRVLITHYRPLYILGQVRKPGVHPFTVGLTVEKAIAVAGGLTRLASVRRMYLSRANTPLDERIRVGLDAHVRPGDILVVEESLF